MTAINILNEVRDKKTGSLQDAQQHILGKETLEEPGYVLHEKRSVTCDP